MTKAESSETAREMDRERDRIEKHTILAAPVSRVWRAISDASELGQWFGIRLEGPFVVGQPMRGTFAGELPHDKIAAFQEKLGLEPAPVKTPPPDAVFCTVVAIEPERRFAFRWIPYGVDAAIDDPAKEPTTLVEFTLQPLEGDRTALTIVESGFSRVPAHRRRRAFLMNDAGWSDQAENIRRFVEAR